MNKKLIAIFIGSGALVGLAFWCLIGFGLSQETHFMTDEVAVWAQVEYTPATGIIASSLAGFVGGTLVTLAWVKLTRKQIEPMH